MADPISWYGRGRWEGFFERALEALLKGSFTCRSHSGADNGAMKVPRARHALLRQARRRIHGLALVGALLASVPAWQAARAGERDDHERARAAVQAGAVLPLATVLERLKRSHPGQVLEVELEQEGGRWAYEIKLLQADGQLLRLQLDASTAQVLEARRKGAPRDKARKDDARD
jgi:uncharacterized membrane protein YkoI